MTTRMSMIALLVASAMWASSMKQQGGHTVQLSTGETVKIAFKGEFEVDRATRKASGGNSNVLFQSSSGTLVAMRTRDSASRRVDTAIWSVKGGDRIGFDIDLGNRRKGLPVPLTVDINGQTSTFSLKGNSSSSHAAARGPSEDDQVRSKLAPQFAKLAPDFKEALKELVQLGHSGYPELGSGWTDLRFLLDPSQIRVDTEMVSEKRMEPEEWEKFVGQFGARF